jgi:hypothetical protein
MKVDYFFSCSSGNHLEVYLAKFGNIQNMKVDYFFSCSSGNHLEVYLAKFGNIQNMKVDYFLVTLSYCQ